MKKVIIIFSALLLMKSAVYAQCDIAQTGFTVTPNIIGVGGFAEFKFTVYNDAGGSACVYAPGAVQVTLAFPSSGYAFETVVSPAGGLGPFFSWVYDAGSRVLVGTNIANIADGDGEIDVKVRVKGTSVKAATASLLNLSILDGSGNNPGNDNASATLTVTIPLAIDFKDVAGIAQGCNALIKWQTATEDNISDFEVQFSTDGAIYKTIGSVQAKNLATGATYQYLNDQGMTSGYYRIRANERSGKIAYSKVVPITTTCKEPRSVFIYPNPIAVGQDAIVNISGYEGSIRGDLYTPLGQLVKTYTLKNGKNTLFMNGLAQGSYTLQVTNDNAKQTFKVTVIK